MAMKSGTKESTYEEDRIYVNIMDPKHSVNIWWIYGVWGNFPLGNGSAMHIQTVIVVKLIGEHLGILASEKKPLGFAEDL